MADPRDNLRPFVKGDPRINRKGRPKSFDKWRELAIDILQEPAKDADGKPIIIDGHIATNAEMIARSWMKDKKRQQSLIEAAFGKVPQKFEMDAKDKIIVTIKNEDAGES